MVPEVKDSKRKKAPNRMLLFAAIYISHSVLQIAL